MMILMVQDEQFVRTQYINPPIYRAQIYGVPRYNVSLCVPPILCFTIEHVLTFPQFTMPPIYRAFLLSPEKHGKSGDYCIYQVGQANFLVATPTLAKNQNYGRLNYKVMTINVFAIIKSIPVEIHVFTLDNTYFAFDSRFYRWITCFCYPKIIVIKKK